MQAELQEIEARGGLALGGGVPQSQMTICGVARIPGDFWGVSEPEKVLCERQKCSQRT